MNEFHSQARIGLRVHQKQKREPQPREPAFSTSGNPPRAAQVKRENGKHDNALLTPPREPLKINGLQALFRLFPAFLRA